VSGARTRPRWAHRGTWLLVGAALLGIGVAVLLADTGRTAGHLDPDNPGADGTRAVSRVLAEDVEVTVARDAQALADAAPGPDDVVVVVRPQALGASTVERLARDADGATVVLLRPDHLVLELFGLPPDATSSAPRTTRAECADTRWQDLELRVDVSLAYPGPGCFPAGDGFLLTEPRAGLVLLGAPSALTNDQVLAGDNAALALRLLGAGERVVWYVPDPADLDVTDAVALGDLLPPALWPGLVLGGCVAVAVLLWRGRRFGALTVEPLPVRVRAAESTRSRGVLYHRAGDRGHAAVALRRASLRHARRHLGVGGGAPEAVARAVSERTGRDPAQVQALLLDDRSPGSDAELIHLATTLAELDREVRTHDQ
jgi:hypothetical protein